MVSVVESVCRIILCLQCSVCRTSICNVCVCRTVWWLTSLHCYPCAEPQRLRWNVYRSMMWSSQCKVHLEHYYSLKKFFKCLVPMGLFYPWEIRVAFTKESIYYIRCLHCKNVCTPIGHGVCSVCKTIHGVYGVHSVEPYFVWFMVCSAKCL